MRTVIELLLLILINIMAVMYMVSIWPVIDYMVIFIWSINIIASVYTIMQIIKDWKR